MHTAGSIARMVDAQVVGSPDVAIARLETIDRADESCLTFARSASFAAGLARSRAGAALVTRGLEKDILAGGFDTASRALLIVGDADRALIKALELFAPAPAAPAAGVHATSVVEPGASVDPTARIGPCCVIAAGARIGPGAVLHSQIHVARDARIGARTIIHAGVVVGERCQVGDGCILHPGVKLGADGFGYIPGKDGLLKVPHIGIVQVGDGVEIGANTCIDRAKFGATTIGAGTKIDNLVQIGHNCVIGRSCILCGQVGLAGSVTLGDGVILAARVGVSDNLTIGAGARIGAAAGVNEDVPAGETWLGAPAMPAMATARVFAGMKKLPEILERLRELEKLSQRDPMLPS